MFVGMDVHKESIDISLAEEGRNGEVRHYGGITGDLEALAKVVKALRSPTRRLRFVYEAGPCGFGIHRYLTAQGEECVVVNPSSMPKRSGDRIKTDRRDGDALARLHRAGRSTFRRPMTKRCVISCAHAKMPSASARRRSIA
jgi:transposase